MFKIRPHDRDNNADTIIDAESTAVGNLGTSPAFRYSSNTGIEIDIDIVPSSNEHIPKNAKGRSLI